MTRCATLARAALVLAAAIPHATIEAQVLLSPTTPRFQEVVRLSQEGFADSARAMLSRILARTDSADPAFAEAVYTGAIVAKSGDEMRRNYSRVAVSFPTSPWADKALLRLAQLDYGNADYESAVQRITRLFSDYTMSPVIPIAALWGARSAFELRDMQRGCNWLNRGIAMVGGDVETKNQLEFLKPRCNVGPGVTFAPVVPESLRTKDSSITNPPGRGRASPPPVIAPPPPPASGRGTKPLPASPWRIQVAAISDKAVIARMVAKIEAAGFTAYRSDGPRGLVRIQVGPFATRELAVAQLAKVKAAVGGSPIVVRAP